MEKKSTGQIIFEKRKVLGLTQQELADRLQITNKAVSKWENGDGMPDVQLLLPLAETLGVTVDELLGGTAKHEIAEKHVSKTAILAGAVSIAVALLFAAAYLINIIKSIYPLNTIINSALLIYWLLIALVFWGKIRKMRGKTAEFVKPISIALFVCGLFVPLTHFTVFRVMDYGIFWFSFALLFSAVHGYRTPYKVFYWLAVVSAFLTALYDISLLSDMSTWSPKLYFYNFLPLVLALIFYIFYGLLEKFTDKYSTDTI